MSDVAGRISIHVGVICLCVPGKLQSQLISEFSRYMHIGWEIAVSVNFRI